MAQETTLAVKPQTQGLTSSDKRPVVTPACDVFENSDEVLLVADLPGVGPDALHITVDKGELLLEARREASPSDPNQPLQLTGCDYHRRFVLPPGIDSSKIKAELKLGVLRLHLAKAEATKPRQIAVTAG